MANQYMQEEDDAILKTYNRYPVVLDHGDGAYLYDPEGKKYLDFSAGYAVSSLGYNNKEFNDALKAQIDKMIHTSNLYYNTTCGKAGEDLKKITGMYKVFFTNSGGEAIEGAIKTARKYAYTKKTGRYEFIAMENSFHGRSMGAVALTGHKEYREPFEPVMPGVHFAIYNDLDSVKALVNDKTCAIILETIQGEGGINAATKEFMQGIRKICDENGILLVADEVQTGFCRTGRMFATNYWEESGVQPDILATAKSIAAGVPLSAIVAREEIMEASAPGTIGGTFCGNALACAAALKTIEIMERDDIAGRSCEIGEKVSKRFNEWKEKYPVIGDVRGLGGMIGLEFVKDQKTKEPYPEFSAAVIKGCAQKGLMIEGAGTYGNVIRFLAPLVMTDEQLEAGFDIYESVIKELLEK